MHATVSFQLNIVELALYVTIFARSLIERFDVTESPQIGKQYVKLVDYVKCENSLDELSKCIV